MRATERERGRVALLHSNGMSAAWYRPLAERLAVEGLTTTLLDIPGFAGVPAPSRPSWDALLERVDRDLRVALPDGGVLVGHSLGGLLGVLLGPRPDVRAMVLLEPAVIPWRWLARLAGGLYVRRVFDRPVAFRNRGPWFWRLHDPDGFPAERIEEVLESHRGADRAFVGALLRDLHTRYPLHLEAITTPTVVVRGASSGPVMALGQRDLVSRLPRARPVTVPRAGHWLVHEQDEELAAVIVGAGHQDPRR